MRISKALKKIILFSTILIITIFLTIIFVPFINENYDHDFSFSISDAIQILVIATAIFLPLISSYWTKQEFGPKVKIKFNKCPPYQRVLTEYIGSSDFKELWIFLGIQNTGKGILKSCEVVLKSIEKKDELTSTWELSKEFIPSNLYWHFSDPKIEQHIHWFSEINPSRELFVCLGHYSELEPYVHSDPKLSNSNKQAESRIILNTLWPSHLNRGVPFILSFAEYLQHRPNAIQQGKYRFTMEIYGENIDPITQVIIFEWSGMPQLSNKANNRIPSYNITLVK